MSITGGSTSYIDIQPSNVPSNSLISYRDGNPVVSFVIAEQDRYLIGSSLRIAGNIAVYKTPSGDHGVVPDDTDDVRTNPKLGVYGIIDQVVLSSQISKNTIEHIRHYGRFLSSYLPLISSQQEAFGHLGETAGSLPNAMGNQLAFTCNENGSAAGGRNYRGNSFCINLPSGFLMSKENIGLSSKGWGVGGLQVDIHLVPDSQFIRAPTENQSFYQLSNLRLIAELINPAPDELSRLMSSTSGTMEYNAISSYYTTIASTNAIVNLRLGLSRVLGVFMNFIPSANLNNLSQDGYQTLPMINNLTSGEIAAIKQITFLKGGMKVPLEYNITANVRDDNSLVSADPQVLRNFMNSFLPFMRNIKTQVSPITYNRVPFKSADEFAAAGQMFGVGVAMDAISGEGLDFRNDTFTLQMETGLTDSSAVQSVFIFVRSKQTLVFNANGLQVIQ